MSELYVPAHVRQQMAEEFAKQIRDQVNSLGDIPDRLAVAKPFWSFDENKQICPFTDYGHEVDIVFEDSLCESGTFITVVFTPGMEAGPSIAAILGLKPKNEDNEEINTTDL